ncbi:MAG: MFS transporter [Sphingomonadaceae bacterium]|nr:MFS transporter [Sphingomonadaceae bacterium]
MALLFMVMLVTAAGNTAMQSVMPSIGTALGVADEAISLAYSWSALLWVFCAPIWARRSDRRGRKAMMALGLAGFTTSFVLSGGVLWAGLAGMMTAIPTLILFALTRSLYGGFGSAAPPAVQAYVASRTPRSERTRALSMVASSFALGTVIGPALAPLMITPGFGLTGPFFIFGLLATGVLVMLRMRLPNDEPQFAARGKAFAVPYSANSPSSDDDSSEDSSKPERLQWSDMRLRPWLTAGLLGGHAHAMILGTVGFMVLDRLNLRDDPTAGAGPIGLVMMSGAIATLLVQWGIIPLLKLGPRASTLWGVLLGGAGTLLVGASQDLHAIAVSFALASMGFGLFRPGFTAGSSLAVNRAEQGQVSGIVTSANGLAFIFGPVIGVWLYNHSDWLSFTTVALLCAAVLILGWRSLGDDAELTASGMD